MKAMGSILKPVSSFQGSKGRSNSFLVKELNGNTKRVTFRVDVVEPTGTRKRLVSSDPRDSTLEIGLNSPDKKVARKSESKSFKSCFVSRPSFQNSPYFQEFQALCQSLECPQYSSCC